MCLPRKDDQSLQRFIFSLFSQVRAHNFRSRRLLLQSEGKSLFFLINHPSNFFQTNQDLHVAFQLVSVLRKGEKPILQGACLFSDAPLAPNTQ